MNPDDPPQLCLRGSLLLADPSLRGGSFHHTVLLLTEHRHDEGAHGYVLNRPFGKNAGHLLHGPEFKALAKVPVFVGGPVSQEQLTFAAFSWQTGPGVLSWATHLTREDAIRRCETGEQVRAFVGYSGWSGGQLENEIKHRSWIVSRPSEAILTRENGEALWGEILTSMGPWYELLSKMPDDPGLN